MDKQLLKKSIEHQAIIVDKTVYRPQVDVVDYGGSLCYIAQISLQNGEALKATSFEVLNPSEEIASLEDVLSLLQSRGEKAFQKGVLPCTSCLDRRLTQQYRECLA